MKQQCVLDICKVLGANSEMRGHCRCPRGKLSEIRHSPHSPHSPHLPRFPHLLRLLGMGGNRGKEDSLFPPQAEQAGQAVEITWRPQRVTTLWKGEYEYMWNYAKFCEYVNICEYMIESVFVLFEFQAYTCICIYRVASWSLLGRWVMPFRVRSHHTISEETRGATAGTEESPMGIKQ